MLKVSEVIVVEGRYDKNAISQAVDATIIKTDGFGIFRDTEKIQLLRRLAKERGIIVLTDNDSAGFLIRGYLKGSIEKDKIKHAYIPDVWGKEKRKTKYSSERKIGVEGMGSDIIVNALKKAGATFCGETASLKKTGRSISKADLYEAGLSGTAHSDKKRKQLQRELELPQNLTANGMLEVLNVLFTYEEFKKYLESDATQN